MNVKRYVSWAVRCLGMAVVLIVAAYASYVGVTWYRYGHVRHAVGAEGTDPLLDSFMPAYDVAGSASQCSKFLSHCRDFVQTLSSEDPQPIFAVQAVAQCALFLCSGGFRKV